MTSKYLVTVADAAGQLGIIGRRVRRLLETGQLKGEQAAPGTAWLVYQASVEAYARNRRGAGRPKTHRVRHRYDPMDGFTVTDVSRATALPSYTPEEVIE